MANHFSHTRTRPRANQMTRLDQAALKRLYRIPSCTNLTMNWGKLRIEAIRMTDCLLINPRSDKPCQIFFVTTQLTFGQRPWYVCPHCERRSAVLYVKAGFLCRSCVKPAYGSQNCPQLDYLTDVIRRKRRELFPNMDGDWILDCTASCDWWPKPKSLHHKTFERKKARLLALEARLNRAIELLLLG
jgi:ribosomal protein L37AE/L43A